MNANSTDRAMVTVDDETTARVVESLVLRGDISDLKPAERARYYVQMCESLGLSPAAQPFALLKLNGKEILYPNRSATDQLAAIHRLNREIVDGPRIVDIGGTKAAYAMCRCTHPNGRVETAVATVPMNDPLNALMKVETKAKRRATISILGLGMLDESEVDAIPSSEKVHVAQIDTSAPTAPKHDPFTPEVIVDAIANFGGHDLTAEQAACILVENRDGLSAEDQAAAFEAVRRACIEGTPAAAIHRAIAAEDARRAPPATDPIGALEQEYARAATADDVVAIDAKVTALGLAKDEPDLARLWKAHKAAEGRLGIKTARPKKTKAATSPTPAEVTQPANDTAIEPADPERASIVAESAPPTHESELARWRERLETHTHPKAVANSVAKHLLAKDYTLDEDAMVCAGIERIVAMTAADSVPISMMGAMNTIREARNTTRAT